MIRTSGSGHWKAERHARRRLKAAPDREMRKAWEKIPADVRHLAVEARTAALPAYTEAPPQPPKNFSLIRKNRTTVLAPRRNRAM